MIARLMGLETIAPRELERTLQAATVIDVNSLESWRNAHVPGARRLDPMTYTASDLPSDRNTALVFYCSNFLCRKAPNAARRAAAMGYTNVRVLSSGIAGWLSAGLPTESA